MFKFEEDMDSDDEDMATDNEEITADDKERDLLELMRNKKLSEIYLELARGMEVMESKSPEDICKGYLFDERASAGARGYSDGQNLAATFVNAFVNAGFHQDKLMTVPSQVSAGSSSGDWVFKNKEHKKVSAAASLGMIFLWDADAGRAQLDKYLDINDNHVLAGALVGLGIVNCNMGHHSDPARELLRAYVNNGDSTTKIGAMMGLGLAYAGSRSIVIRQKLIPILKDKEAPIEVISFAAISLGLAYVGSCKRQIVSAIKSALWNKRDSILGKPLYRLCLLALCLVYLGKQDALDYEVLAGLDGEFKRYFKITLQSCAYAGSGNVDQVHLLVNRCNMPLWAAGPSQGSAVLGIAMVAMGEELGLEMAIRMLDHFLQYGNLEIRRAVPLALGLLCISNPKVNVMNTLSQLSKDRDIEVAMSAVISLGLIGAGTRNGRIANTLHELSVFYYRSTEPNLHFCIQIAQGLVHLGKGLLTLAPYHSDHFLISPTALAGIIIVLHACLDMKGIILGEYHYILYYLALAMKPRMLMTVDDNLRPLSVPVRVGQAAKPLSVSGPPKTITGSQMHATTPVLLGAGQIAELATEKYIPLSPFLEGVVILKEKPELNEAR